MSSLQLRILSGVADGRRVRLRAGEVAGVRAGNDRRPDAVAQFHHAQGVSHAVATGAVVLAVLNGFGFVKLQPKAALYAADIVGGLILGAGIALAGACPGTTLAQIGAGYRDAIFTLVGGLPVRLRSPTHSPGWPSR